MNRRLLAILSGVLICVGAVHVSGAAGETQKDEAKSSRLITAVKVLPAPEPAPAMQMGPMVQREVAKPTTPGGKLPQYQLHHLNRRALDSADVSDPRLRLLLALPNAPILVEAAITVDDKPYLMPREARVQDLLKFVADPVVHREMQLTIRERAAALLAKMKETAAAKLAEQEAKEGEKAPESDEPDASVVRAEGDEAADAEPAAEVVQEVAEYVEPASVYERIERYMTATEERPTDSELRWLLTDWIDGPPVLLLNDNYQRFRADQTPVFDILDRDRDQIVSTKELELAVSSFNECDLNRDGLVQYAELTEVARDPRNQAKHAGHGKLMFLLPNADTATSIYERLAHRYNSGDTDSLRLPRFDTNNNGSFDTDEIADLQSRPADLKLSISFNTTRPTKSKIEVVSIADEFADSTSTPEINPNSLTMHLAGSLVDFTAVQRSQSDQVSVGAIDDGYPMLPVVDPNDDGRFTIRELRSLKESLLKFDTNNDGTLTQDETRNTVRVCIGLGPLAHLELGSVRSAARTDSTPVEAGPEWFVRMDGNKDGDLTRAEFLGTDEQFVQYDADADELLSAAEANSEIESE